MFKEIKSSDIELIYVIFVGMGKVTYTQRILG
jgi:hypothetical protein